MYDYYITFNDNRDDLELTGLRVSDWSEPRLVIEDRDGDVWAISWGCLDGVTELSRGE